MFSVDCTTSADTRNGILHLELKVDKRARLNEGLADCLLTHVVMPPARSRLACEDRRALRGGVCSEREEAPRLSLA